ncbi:MAG: polysaccharide biosynthesis/export family protein [Vicinamibacterales bacterium]
MVNFRSIRSLLALAVLVATSAPAAAQASRPAPTARTPATSSASTAAAAVPADYIIGAEDVLGVLFWREQEMSGDVAVRPDGMITLPLVGDIKAAGLRPETLRAAIETAASKYLTDPNVTIVVRQLNSQKVFITGQVATPGAFPLTGPRTVMQLIALAGGLNEYADSSKITIMREEGGKTRSFKFNYKDVSKGKKLEQNIQLKPGDTVVVP